MNTNWDVRDMPSLKGQLALVTGANRGLGLEIARRLAGAGAEVELACRDIGKGQKACDDIRNEFPTATVSASRLDVANLGSISAFARDFRSRRDQLDILCHNAGAIMVPTLQKTADGFELQMGTNHLGAFALTGQMMVPLAAAPHARVVNNSSMAHRMARGLDPDDINGERKAYKTMEAYGRSKLASLLFSFELARRLSRAGATVISVAAHPGIANTNPGMGSIAMRAIAALLAQSPAMGALPALYAASASEVKNGTFYGPGGFNQLRGYPQAVESAPIATNPALAAALWRTSERLTGVSYLS